MRKAILTLVSAAALAIPLISMSGTAATGATKPMTNCKKASGKATFTPPLPQIGSTKKVLSTVKVTNGKEMTCTGGGVKSAVASATIKFKTPGNCQTLASGSGGAITGQLKLTWNNKKTSTINATLKQVKNHATQASITGPVTAGLFKGDHASQTINFVISSAGGDCVHGPLKYVTFTQQTALSIK
jgi:hypothetical protein